MLAQSASRNFSLTHFNAQSPPTEIKSSKRQFCPCGWLHIHIPKVKNILVHSIEHNRFFKISFEKELQLLLRSKGLNRTFKFTIYVFQYKSIIISSLNDEVNQALFALGGLCILT